MQSAVDCMGYDIGFLFKNDKDFYRGLKTFRADSTRSGLRPGFERLLEAARENWQSELNAFRRFLEHQTGDRRQFNKFYDPKNAEALFEVVWRTIADILPALLELRLRNGVKLVEQRPDDPAPRWPQRFRYHHPAFTEAQRVLFTTKT